jgi:hypothetical protein
MGARPQKYLVCHKTKGKTPTYNMMMVPSPALKGHRAHGDHIWEEERFSDRCQDGIDNDCNGVVDMDEPICPHDVCEEPCFIARNECEDPCWYDVLASCTGGDPECLFGCDPACLELLDACLEVCEANYGSCVAECPDRQ